MMINSHDDYLLTRTLCKDLATFLRLILSFWLCAFVALFLLLASNIHFTITTTALLVLFFFLKTRLTITVMFSEFNRIISFLQHYLRKSLLHFLHPQKNNDNVVDVGGDVMGLSLPL